MDLNYSLDYSKAFIEEQFPVSIISKESYKERKAGSGQTLTGVGKWWGRKPLVLVRATIIGLLMPVSNNPQKDREIFLKILTMDNDGLWQRVTKPLPIKDIYNSLSKAKQEAYFTQQDKAIRWQSGISKEEKEKVSRKYFDSLSYDEKLTFCDRPEQIKGASKEAWAEINNHLQTTANSLSELVQQLGEKRFNRTPKVGDPFCGGGSIPFEAARIGCEAYASDLNPVATLLTWAALNIVGGSEEVQKQIKEAQEKAFNAVNQQIIEWGIEHNEKGWRADAYLYCVEAKSPVTGYLVPLAPSWVISDKYKVVAVLEPDHKNKRYHIKIVENADTETFNKAKKGTIQNGRLICPESGESFAISEIRGDRKIDGKSIYGLRLWENDDLIPRSDDVFQERLYCVRYVETYTDSKGKEQTKRHYCTVNNEDLAREEKVLKLLQKRFHEWQEKGFIPSRKIEEGAETTRLFRERGWTYWHHLFNPRQLFYLGLYMSQILNISLLLGFGKEIDMNSRLCRWGAGREESKNVFSNQALNTLYNFSCKSFLASRNYFDINLQYYPVLERSTINNQDARLINSFCGIWITDPPYADAVNYHELSDFFLCWYEKLLSSTFPSWYTDSRKALAVAGSGEDFKKSMVEIYTNLTQNMPNNGLQVVMFTHQNPSVWADLGMILWASGLKVSSAWTIATETDSALKKGNYVQGTVLLVLRKRLESEPAFLDEIYPLIEDEVQSQLEFMLKIDDKDQPNFGDTDYQLAAYASSLRVLTQFSEIEGMDIKYELFRERKKGEKSEFEKVIDRAVEIACNYLIPQGFSEFYWKSLTADERLYLKGLELEKHGELRTGAYQELAKGFGVKDYSLLYAKTKSNEARFKTASEFKRSHLTGSGFAGSQVRAICFGIHETVKKENSTEGLNYLKAEIPDYWNARKRIIEILRFLSKFEHIPHMTHWQADAQGARVLAGTVENDHA